MISRIRVNGNVDRESFDAQEQQEKVHSFRRSMPREQGFNSFTGAKDGRSNRIVHRSFNFPSPRNLTILLTRTEAMSLSSQIYHIRHFYNEIQLSNDCPFWFSKVYLILDLRGGSQLTGL